MPFNANTYRANKYQRTAWKELARAREAKARGETNRVPTLVKLARISMRLSRRYRKLKNVEGK